MHSDTVSAIASAVQATVVTGAAGLAWWQVSEARRLREDQAKPYVVVSLETGESSPTLLYLGIRNYGTTAARDIHITFEPQLTSTLDRPGDNRITQWSALGRGIPTLVPGQSMKTLIDSLFSRYQPDSGSRSDVVHATVTYQSDQDRWKNHGNHYRYIYDLDFGVFFGMHFTTETTMDDVVKALDGIKNTVTSWTVDKGIKVYTGDLDRLQEEQRKSYLERRLAYEVEKAEQAENGKAGDGAS